MAYWSSTALVCSLAALGLTGCAARASLPTYAVVPDFKLTDQNNAPFDSASTLKGHVWVADFMFTSCPGPCPRMSSQMRQVQTALTSTGVRLVSYTIDPDHDTPRVLANYASNYHAQDGVWYFLTGPVETLRMLDRDVFKTGRHRRKPGPLHPLRADRPQILQVRGFYLTSEPDAIARVIADAKSLLKERP